MFCKRGAGVMLGGLPSGVVVLVDPEGDERVVSDTAGGFDCAVRVLSCANADEDGKIAKKSVAMATYDGDVLEYVIRI